MMGTKERCFAPLITVSLEDLVPADHFYLTLSGPSTSRSYANVCMRRTQLEVFPRLILSFSSNCNW
jgi:hypothetical protein